MFESGLRTKSPNQSTKILFCICISSFENLLLRPLFFWLRCG
ncbi:hypothetical protein AN2363V1_4588 [Klebsiella oxytoca]|nr:hypothetical protein AN2363V1_4588 [Klebsiella oxytoca]CAH6222627.1 hypothetical protein AN2363V1_4588 [Klebsiella oxytoca]